MKWPVGDYFFDWSFIFKPQFKKYFFVLG